MAQRRVPYDSIGVQLEQLAELKALKFAWEQRARKKFAWGDFLTILVTLHQPSPTRTPQDVRFAEMHQEERPLIESSSPKLAGRGTILTLEPASAFVGRASLSDETIERIAELVAAKIVDRIELLNRDKTSE